MCNEDVKEYLRQIKVMQAKIENKKEQLEELRESITSISAGTEGERVKTSSSGNKIENSVIKCMMLSEQIAEMICEMERKKNEIIENIHKLTDERYIKILTARYVYGYSMCEIAVMLSYEHKWTCRLHGNALTAFRKVINTNKQECK